MNRIALFVGLFLALVWASGAWGDIPELRDGGYVQLSGSRMDAGYYTAPEAVDWNEDGKKDLVVGKFYRGDAMLYLNEGTDATPVFNSGSLIQVGGRNLNVGYT